MSRLACKRSPQRARPSPAAEAAGFRPGDRLLTIGSVKTRSVKLQRPGMPIGARNSAPVVPITARTPAAPIRAVAGTTAGAAAGAAAGTVMGTAAAASPISSLEAAPISSLEAAPISSLEAAPISSLEETVEAIRAAVGARAPFDILIERGGREMTVRVPTLSLAQVLPDDL